MISDCRKRKTPAGRMIPTNPALPTIHVHNHLPGSSIWIDSQSNTSNNSPPAQPALPTAVKRHNSTPSQHPSHPTKQPRVVIDLTKSDSDNEDLHGICYPTIHEMLAELHSELPLLGVIQYEHILAENGLLYINQLVGEEIGYQLHDGLGIPFGVIMQLQSHAVQLMRRTQKSRAEGGD